MLKGVKHKGFVLKTVIWATPLLRVLVITLGKVIQYWTMHGRSHLLDIFLR